MSSTVTPSVRAVSWNVIFTAGQNARGFAGIYQVEGSDLVTFRDVCDELRLCFDIEDTAWANIAFFLTEPTDVKYSSPVPLFVGSQDFDQPVPSLPGRSPQIRNVISYHVVHHKDCQLPSDAPLQAHLQAKCAQRLPIPVRRREPRYLPVDKASSDPRIAVRPLRRVVEARSQSPPSRYTSGSASPITDSWEQAEDEELGKKMLVPAGMALDLDQARRVASEFRSSCLNTANCCAVSGEGEAWCFGQIIGPGLQVCHIVPQQHYHLYPSANGTAVHEHGPVENSPRRLQEAWENTWDPGNGILLMKHLGEFFDARLFSIHPLTLRIRVFVPYNALTRFNGQRANVPETVDLEALRFHYEMACIENMAAKKPDLHFAPVSASGVMPGFECAETPLGTIEGHKRRRLNDDQVGIVSSSHSSRGQWSRDVVDSYVTPYNSREFLADVNWELRKFKA